MVVAMKLGTVSVFRSI